MTMSLADNLLQKQQKQQKRREQGRCGNPALHSGDVAMDRGLGGRACQQVICFSARRRHDDGVALGSPYSFLNERCCRFAAGATTGDSDPDYGRNRPEQKPTGRYAQ
jgi:hypothetical protein